MIRLDEEEETKKTEAQVKLIDSKIDETLLKLRRLFLCEAVDMESSKELIRKLWFLEHTDPGKPILFVINSPGGSVDAGWAIWDQIKLITSPVTTLVTGLAASMGSVLSLAAAPKRRFSTPHARIMIHQPHVMGLIRGQATDLAIHAEEIEKSRGALVELYSKQTGKDYKTIEKALDRDNWFSAKEALDFGLLDGIITSFKDLKM
jgi:ATP-dependent Clp protease, protease subunit